MSLECEDLQTIAPPACRDRTAVSRRQSVESAIGAMAERLGEPLSLATIASAAAASPYHFDRIFRQVTGVRPIRFLAALRLDAARRLLLTTRYSATSICFQVGYSSLGTFTQQFTAAVGMPPHRLRCFAAALPESTSLLGKWEAEAEASPSDAADVRGISGRVDAPEGFEGVIFVGLFRTSVPKGRPSACVLLHEAGPFRMGVVEDGTYYVFAAGVNFEVLADAGPESLLQDDVLRGTADPIRVGDEEPRSEVVVALRQPAITDPPILVSLPVLLAERFSAGAASGP